MVQRAPTADQFDAAIDSQIAGGEEVKMNMVRTVPRGALHIDRFSAGLDDLTRKEQGDQIIVLRRLSTMKRFSEFEASDNPSIARTMTNLFKEKLVESTGGSYPWTEFKLTDAGKAALAAAAFADTKAPCEVPNK